MSDKTDKKGLPERPSPISNTLPAALNDFSHRSEGPLVLQEPSDLVTTASPAQRERIVYMVDQALDTMEGLLTGAKDEVRLKAAENVLDRSGIAKVTKHEGSFGSPDIPADALVQVIGGLAGMFGMAGKAGKATEGMRLAGNGSGTGNEIGNEIGNGSGTGSGTGSEGRPDRDARMASETAEGVIEGSDSGKGEKVQAKVKGLPQSYLNSLVGNGG